MATGRSSLPVDNELNTSLATSAAICVKSLVTQVINPGQQELTFRMVGSLV